MDRRAMLLAARAGDPAALEVLAAWFLSELVGFFSSRNFAADHVDDLSQKTAVALLLKLDSAPLDPRKLAGWVRSFAILETRGQWREAQRDRARAAMRKEHARLQSPPPSVDAQLLEREQWALVEHYLKELPPKHCQIVRLYLAGHDYKTIAEHLEIPQGTARSAVTQTKRRFKFDFKDQRVTRSSFRSPEKAP